MKKLLLGIFIFTNMLMFVPLQAGAATEDCNDLKKIVTDSISNKQLSDQVLGVFNTRLCTASDFLLFIINLIFAFSGGVAVLMIVYGGFRYVTSGGDPKAVEAAKNTITYAVAGVAVILLSFSIINIATRLLTQPTVTVPGSTTTTPDGNKGNGNGDTDKPRDNTEASPKLTNFIGTLLCRTVKRTAGETGKPSNTCPTQLFKLEDGTSPSIYEDFDMEVEVIKDSGSYELNFLGFLYPKTGSCAKVTRSGGVINDCPDKYKPRRVKIVSTFNIDGSQYFDLEPCTSDPNEVKARRTGSPANESCKKLDTFLTLDTSNLTKKVLGELNAGLGIQDDTSMYVYVTVESPVLDASGNVKSWEDDQYLISPGLMKFKMQ